MYYIQRQDAGDRSKRTLETVDEFTTWKETRAMLGEYRLSDPSGYYYASTRACKNWSK